MRRASGLRGLCAYMTDPISPSVDVSALIDADWPEWRAALEDIRREYGDEGVRALLRRLQEYSIDQGVTPADALLNTPYTNTLSPHEQPLIRVIWRWKNGLKTSFVGMPRQ
jgi:hypothetical protein